MWKITFKFILLLLYFLLLKIILYSSILDGSAYDPCFFSLDGNVRISDGAHTSDTKFIGVTDVDYFGQAEANQFTVINSYIDAPTAGSLTKDPANPATAVTVNNALALIVQQKTALVLVMI